MGTIFFIISIVWIGGTLLYFYYKTPKPQIIAQTVIEKRDNEIHHKNIFSPEESQIPNFTVNLIYDDKETIDTNQYCDLVLSVKDLINYNSKEIKEKQHDVFKDINISTPEKEQKKEEILLEKKGDTDFKKLFNINNITK